MIIIRIMTKREIIVDLKDLILVRFWMYLKINLVWMKLIKFRELEMYMFWCLIIVFQFVYRFIIIII